MFERLGGSNTSEEQGEKIEAKGSPERLMKALKLFVEGGVKHIEILGQENLDKIPAGRKVIVVTSHISDMDLPIAAYAVGEKLNVAITTDSFQHHLTQNPISNIGFRIAGQDNFLPIQHSKQTRHGEFRPENFEAMEDELQKGKAIVIAGHAPSIEKDPDKVVWHLPDKGTIGAEYLAQMADAIIVPVSVNIKSERPTGMGADSIKRGITNLLETMKGKPDVDVMIGEPMELPKIESIETFSKLMEDRTIENRQEKFKKIRAELEASSDVVMEKLASILPESKRGVWGKEEDSETQSEHA